MHTSHSHHLHLRKRIHQKHEVFPHPDRIKRDFDKVMFVVAILGPLTTLPQIVQVFTAHTAIGLSLTTWMLWTILSGIWLVYGFLHKDLPIILSQCLYLIFNAIVVFAIISFS